MESLHLNIDDIPKYLINSELYNIILSNKNQNIDIGHYSVIDEV